MKEETVERKGKDDEKVEKEEKEKAKRVLVLRISAILVIVLAIILLFFIGQSFIKFAVRTVIVTGLCLIYTALATYLAQQLHRRPRQGNPSHNFVFRGPAGLTPILTLL